MSRYKLQYQKMELPLRQPFTISRGTKDSVSNVLIQLASDGYVGYGEAAPNSRYDEDAEKVVGFLEQLPPDYFDEIRSPHQLYSKLNLFQSESAIPSVTSARAAVEMAWLDLWAKKQGRPLWKLWESESQMGPPTSYTIGLDKEEIMQEKVRDADLYPILKVKLGTDRDRKIIAALRRVTDKPLRVDANEGWSNLHEAKGMIGFLKDHDIEMVEQPMPARQFEDLVSLKKWSPLPIVADESFMGDESLREIVKAFDGINIKLMKIGSLIKARRIIREAKELGLKTMIGCMIESSVANTAGALLSLWADYADLDGHLLIRNDPAEGLRLDDQKRIIMPDTPGLGVSLKEELS